ncbi:MAG TPA: hypothetical protein VGI54_04320, partial [Solirubrobacteraceae bacterium]
MAFDGDRIVAAGPGEGPAGATDLGDAVLAPAFVDLQVNGLGSVDLATAEPAEMVALARELARRGVGAFCPTLTTRAADEYAPWLGRVEAARAAAVGDRTAATLLGAHLEGPFLGAAPGVHDPTLISAADVPWLDRLLEPDPGGVAVVTIAPEADPGLVATRMLVARG